MNTSLVSAIAIALSLAPSACAGTAGADAPPPPPATTTHAASAVTDLTGTWGFVLGSSDVAARVRSSCDEEARGDAASSAACYRRVEAAAAKEKIRFARDREGKTVWTSFGEHEEGRAAVFLTVPVELSPDGAGHVLAKIAGQPTGEHAARLASAKVESMRIDIVDDRTIALTDPKKGRLVYAKE